MLKKTFTFEDYNGVSRTETHYFNMNEAELAEIELGTTGGFTAMLQRIIDAKDAPAIMRELKKIILKSYGVKSDDGRRFIKSEQLSEEFSQTEAYTQLYMSLISDADAASEFVKGIMPSKLTSQLPANPPQLTEA